MTIEKVVLEGIFDLAKKVLSSAMDELDEKASKPTAPVTPAAVVVETPPGDSSLARRVTILNEVGVSSLSYSLNMHDANATRCVRDYLSQGEVTSRSVSRKEWMNIACIAVRMMEQMDSGLAG